MNLSQNPGNSSHEAGDGQESDVGLGVPIVPSDQPAPVV